MADFTHFNEQGRAKMVDVGEKPSSRRTAVAAGRVLVNDETFALIRSGGIKKGDVLISGVVDTKYGRSFYVHSIGEITGIYTEKMTFSEKYVTEEKVCTGEVCAKALKIFGHKLIYSPAELPTGDYEYSETEERVTFLGISLPLYKITGHYRLTENRSITITKEQAELNIAKRAFLCIRVIRKYADFQRIQQIGIDFS